MSGRTRGADPSLPRRNLVCQSPQAGHEGVARHPPHQLLLPIPPGTEGTKDCVLVTFTGCQFMCMCVVTTQGQASGLLGRTDTKYWAKTFSAPELSK